MRTVLQPVIYFRGSLAEQSELDAASKHFPVVQQRTKCGVGDLVIPRYSALPWNKELCDDLKELGAEPINSYREHCYVADLRNWYYDLADFTPRTWFALDQAPKDGGPFFVKGATNSRKHLWSTHAYAPDWYAARDVFMRLAEDTTIGVQPIYLRQFVPLRKLGEGLNGLPISEEYRFFFLDGQIVGSGFYWSGHVDEAYNPDVVPSDFISRVVAAVGTNIRFWVADFARTEAGDWIVVELNDGQQSGLSDVDPDKLYGNIKKVLAGRKVKR